MQTAMSVHANNIANAETPGYRRQDVMLQNRFFGGVDASARSSFDSLTATRVSQLDGLAAETGAKAAALGTLEKSLSNSATNLSSSVNSLREAISTAADHPGDKSLREIVAVRAGAFASEATAGLQQLDSQLGDIAKQQADVRTAATAKVKELASLNKDAHAYPNNLEIRDRQVQVGRELADLVGGEIKFDEKGAASFTVNGTQVVNGSHNPLDLPELTGGQLGGLQASATVVKGFRDTFANTLSSFSTVINDTNAQGVDGTGAAGQPLFSFNGAEMKFVGSATGLALDTAGSVNGNNGRALAGLDSLGKDLGALASKAATQAETAASEFGSRASTLDYALQEQASREGVDIDQETVLMKNAQRLYEANAKVIQVQDSLFGTLLNIVA
jgi:flagellar hook-associated protein 1 FlgK